MDDMRVQVESERIQIGNDYVRCTTNDVCLIKSLLIQMAEKILTSADGESVCIPVEVDKHYYLPLKDFEDDQTCRDDFPTPAVIHLTATKNDEKLILRLVHILDSWEEFKWSNAAAFLLREKKASGIYYTYPYPFGVYQTKSLIKAFFNAEIKVQNQSREAESTSLKKQLLLPKGNTSDEVEEIKQRFELAFVKQLLSEIPKSINNNSDLDALVQALQSDVEIVHKTARQILKQNPSLSTLKALLSAQQWRAADEITSDIIFDSFHPKKTPCSMIETLKNISYEKLSTLDQVWLEHSQEKFGFSVQVHIWQNIDGNHSPNWLAWCDFGQQVGWYVEDSWLWWNDLNFTLTAPPGHLPRVSAFAGWGLGDFWNGCRILSILAAKLVAGGDR